MVISVGSDHAGYGLKVKMIPYLESLGHTIIDQREQWSGGCGLFSGGGKGCVPAGS